MADRWDIRIDTGGTFTDGIGTAPDGSVRRVKVLSSSALRGVIDEQAGSSLLRIRAGWDGPGDFSRGLRFRLLGGEAGDLTVVSHDPDGSLLRLSGPLPGPVEPGTPFELLSDEEAPVLAARLLTGTAPGEPVPVSTMRLGTTLGTNALLQRRGVPTALFITRGFADLLLIGNQQRPELFTLDIRKPPPLYREVVEVPGRIGPAGEIEDPFDPAALEEPARRLRESGIRVAAVALLHSYRNPAHEEALSRFLLSAGFRHVSRSSDLAPEIRILPRAVTTVVDAYLAPVVRGYLDRVRQALGDASLHVMTSAGGLVRPEAFRPKDSLLSGPAGGVVGAATAGRRSGRDRVIAFDMGGTSTDVARYDRDYEYVFEHAVADARLMAPALAIESVAAGGGSLCWFDGDRLRVGPESAGADPGPACYGAGGPLSMTDINLLLGRLVPDRFGIPVDAAAADRSFRSVLSDVEKRHGFQERPEELLQGWLDIANERMADAIRTISLRRGYDPAGYVLVSFGGAGPQHACGVARRLGIATVVVPCDSGLLSALGLDRAVIERFSEMQVLRPLDEIESLVPGWLEEMEEKARSALRAEGIEPGAAGIRRRIAQVRFLGQDSSLEMEIEEDRPLGESFRERYAEMFGHRPEERRVELVSLRVVASSAGEEEVRTDPAAGAAREAEPARTMRSWFGGRYTDVPVFDREALACGDRLSGPALVGEKHSVTVVEPGWDCRVDGAGALILERRNEEGAAGVDHRPEAVRLELFTHRFETIAREMGERLRRTAVSTNVKERLDFSCALLDPSGELLVNAPHIPVHLGALGLCVRTLRKRISMAPGDVVVTNHPAFGGSHLPDVTVVTPVFVPAGNSEPSLLAYVASRAHHAEIGGTAPGSMPPSARTLEEEGVVIPPTHILRAGVARWEDLRTILASARHPTRSIEDNLADIEAAVAANHAGERALTELAGQAGPETVLHYMGRLQDLAERRLRESLASLEDGIYRAEERLDDGSPIAVRMAIRGDRAEIDFTGSAGVHPGNLNATPAIVHSAVIFFLRLLVKEPIPLNEGFLRAVSIEIPGGMLNPPFPDDPSRAPAVVGGNVETSQRIVDTLTRALALAGCSQGTMNNVLFGNERLGYYETVCGGCGGGDGFPGASAVHSNMTNTRSTDPEILEHRYPVRVERFAIRRGSGGGGAYPGGDGVVRELRFLEPMTLSVLTQHRLVAPFGTADGEPGSPGRQQVVRADGTVHRLGPVDGTRVLPGDRFVLDTPGGGGYGRRET
jgi:5-oxoprolinase (ATP-hydrolysing)